ncbi:MAG: cold shock domain-containing protein CspD [Pseudomonadales bacterium]
MHTGVVKWFNNAKGYGFILSENSSGDIFAHYSAIKMDGYKTLKAGQKVQFTTEDGPKGVHAVDIQAIEDANAQATTEQASQATQQPTPAQSPGEQELA